MRGRTMRTFRLKAGLLAGALALLAGCETTGGGAPTTSAQAAPAHEQKALPKGLDASLNPDPFPSTYTPMPSQPTAIVGANILTATGQEIDGGVVVMAEGKILSVGPAGTAFPAGAVVIDGKGRWVTPGVIDGHSHLGVYPSPAVQAHSDGKRGHRPQHRAGLGRKTQSGRKIPASTAPAPAV